MQVFNLSHSLSSLRSFLISAHIFELFLAISFQNMALWWSFRSLYGPRGLSHHLLLLPCHTLSLKNLYSVPLFWGIPVLLLWAAFTSDRDVNLLLCFSHILVKGSCEISDGRTAGTLWSDLLPKWGSALKPDQAAQGFMQLHLKILHRRKMCSLTEILILCWAALVNLSLNILECSNGV